MSTRTVLRGAVAAACGGALVVAGAGPAAGAVGDPPGNNGTVKVDEAPFDDHPDNEPHVGCVFQVDLYGYDEGDLEATVTFTAHPPTEAPDDGDDEVDENELLTDTLDIGGDAAGGGTDLDASGTYDLTEALAAIEPHPEQGWHVKLTVHAEGSQGADTKHKVFWVDECAPPGPTTTVPGPTTTVPGGPTTTVPGGPTTTTPTGPTTTVPGGPTTSAPQVGPTSPTTAPGPGGTTPTSAPAASTTTTTAPGGSLPRTGSNTVPLVAAALALVATGGGVLVGARRLRGGAGS